MTDAKRVLTDAQRDLLTQVLDRVVPAGGGLPAAGELGVGEFVESVAGSSAVQTRLLVDGLTRIGIAVESHGSGAFGELDDEARDEALRAVESDAPEFFDELVRLTYVGYYSKPTNRGGPRPGGAPAAAAGVRARAGRPVAARQRQRARPRLPRSLTGRADCGRARVKAAAPISSVPCR